MSLSFACSLFGYSRQVYYRAKKRAESHQKKAKEVIALVQGVRSTMPRIGGKKLYHLLAPRLKEMGVGRDKLFTILKANKLLIKPKKRYHITTQSHHRFRKHQNRIEQLNIERPEQVWVSDITYVGQRNNPYYLALVTDAYSKKILGYDLSKSLATPGTLRALKMALKQRQYPDQSLIHHSDRGLQYCSDAYQRLLKRHQLRCSMTEKYDPYQNAVAERVNGILKQEFLLDYKGYDLKLMQQLIKQSVSIYNQKRPHLSCQLNTPNFMHQQCQIKIKTYKTKRIEQLNALPVQ